MVVLRLDIDPLLAIYREWPSHALGATRYWDAPLAVKLKPLPTPSVHGIISGHTYRAPRGGSVSCTRGLKALAASRDAVAPMAFKTALDFLFLAHI